MHRKGRASGPVVACSQVVTFSRLPSPALFHAQDSSPGSCLFVACSQAALPALRPLCLRSGHFACSPAAFPRGEDPCYSSVLGAKESECRVYTSPQRLPVWNDYERTRIWKPLESLHVSFLFVCFLKALYIGSRRQSTILIMAYANQASDRVA